jgi:hypothetical protein
VAVLGLHGTVHNGNQLARRKWQFRLVRTVLQREEENQSRSTQEATKKSYDSTWADGVRQGEDYFQTKERGRIQENSVAGDCNKGKEKASRVKKADTSQKQGKVGNSTYSLFLHLFSQIV